MSDYTKAFRGLFPFLSQAPLPPDQGERHLDNQRGQIFAPRDTHTGECGTIIDFDAETHTYQIKTDSGGILSAPRRTQDAGDKRQFSPGTYVTISHAYGSAVITGMLPYTHEQSANENRISFTGVESPTALTAGKAYSANHRTPNTPADIGPGDWVQTDEDGTTGVGVLAGGVAMLKAGMSQVQVHTVNNLLQLICQNYKLHTAMGTSEIKNEGGRISWKFRGGSDQLKEAGSTQENWTIRMDLGAEGDLFTFELTRPNGTTLFRLHVSGDGKIELFGAQGIDLMGGGPHTQKHLEGRALVIKKDDAQEIGGAQTKTVGQDRNITISGSDSLVVGNDVTQSVGRHRVDTVNGNHDDKVVGGSYADAKSGNVARSTTINNGSWEIEIGSPTNGANPAASAGHKISVFTGDIEHTITTKGDIDLNTLAGAIHIITKLGTANIDGSVKVKVGKESLAFHPALHGDTHNRLINQQISTRTAPMPAYLAATQALAAVITPPLLIVYIIPVAGPMLFFILAGPLWLAKLQGEFATNTAHYMADLSLQALLRTMLSNKVDLE